MRRVLPHTQISPINTASKSPKLVTPKTTGSKFLLVEPVAGAGDADGAGEYVTFVPFVEE